MDLLAFTLFDEVIMENLSLPHSEDECGRDEARGRECLNASIMGTDALHQFRRVAEATPS
ncbi:MAG: hypothetical protein MI717_09135 [Spirochaetales bacterium]|nr:hypothetical protein [Spirochaetales bacterium]